MAIDFGSKNIGIALVQHGDFAPNRVLYAGTIFVAARPMNEAVVPRAESRRIRRTRKTHVARLRRLAQALRGIRGSSEILRFCKRRGFSHDAEDSDDASLSFQFPREQFFAALKAEICRVVPAADHDRVTKACSKHLNEAKRRSAEIRPCDSITGGRRSVNGRAVATTSRADNACRKRLQEALFVWLKPVFEVTQKAQQLRKSVVHWIGELCKPRTALRRTGTRRRGSSQGRAAKAQSAQESDHKHIRARVRQEAPADLADSFDDNWAETYGRNVTEIVAGAGRSNPLLPETFRYVRRLLLDGRAISNRTAVTLQDLFGRKQQILLRGCGNSCKEGSFRWPAAVSTVS